MFEVLFVQSKQSQLLVDLQKDAVLRWNPAFEEAFGPIPEETSWWDFLTSASQCCVDSGEEGGPPLDLRSQLTRGNDVEITLTRRDHSRHTFLVSSNRFVDGF